MGAKGESLSALATNACVRSKKCFLAVCTFSWVVVVLHLAAPYSFGGGKWHTSNRLMSPI